MLKAKLRENEPNFEDRISKYTDEELLDVLKKRSYYTNAAVNYAVGEAIKRGLIYSEQDLFAPKFKEEKMQFTWFPVPNNREARKKIKRSIIRNLIIAGLIPVIYGLSQLYRGEGEFAESAVIFGLLWVLLTYLLTRQKMKPILVVLSAADLLGGAYMIQYLIGSSSPVIEFFIVIVLMLMVLYGLIFYYRIAKADQKN